MAVRQKQNKKIFIETEYDNIVIVNPNEVYNSEGKNEERLVDHEDLVYYANLETFIIPRTKLAIGQSFTDPVVNTTIATIFGGEEDLKINFLKPRGKSDFDTSWSNQLTGEGSRQGVAINQNKEKVVNFEGRKTFERSVGKYEDTQLLGIKSIKVKDPRPIPIKLLINTFAIGMQVLYFYFICQPLILLFVLVYIPILEKQLGKPQNISVDQWFEQLQSISFLSVVIHSQALLQPTLIAFSIIIFMTMIKPFMSKTDLVIVSNSGNTLVMPFSFSLNPYIHVFVESRRVKRFVKKVKKAKK